MFVIALKKFADQTAKDFLSLIIKLHLLQKIIKSVDNSLNTVIAKTENKLYINDDKKPDQRVIRYKETNLGDLISDSYYWYFNEKLGLNCDITIANGGAMRTDVAPGEISYATMKMVSPF